MRTSVICITFQLVLYQILAMQLAQAQERPKDNPKTAAGIEQVKKMREAIDPYVKRALKELPQVKERFRKGLAKGETLYLTIFFPASNGAFEHGFVKITNWNSTIHGVVSSDLILLEEPKAGDQVTFQEDVVLDWTITKPDGSEEGNLVGKFLDSYNPQR